MFCEDKCHYSEEECQPVTINSDFFVNKKREFYAKGSELPFLKEDNSKRDGEENNCEEHKSYSNNHLSLINSDKTQPEGFSLATEFYDLCSLLEYLTHNKFIDLKSPIESSDFENSEEDDSEILRMSEIASKFNLVKRNPCAALAKIGNVYVVAYNKEIISENQKQIIKIGEVDYKISNIEFLPNENNAHAEMIVLNHIINECGKKNDEEKKAFKNTKIYIGTSMKPCFLCFKALKFVRDEECYKIFYQKSSNDLFIGKGWPTVSFILDYERLLDSLVYNLNVSYIYPNWNFKEDCIDKDKAVECMLKLTNFTKKMEQFGRKKNMKRYFQHVQSCEKNKKLPEDSPVVQNPRQGNSYLLNNT